MRRLRANAGGDTVATNLLFELFGQLDLLAKLLISLARPEGFEPPTPRFVVWCSIQLSYGRLSHSPPLRPMLAFREAKAPKR
jgi:hypothetical protein